MPVLRVVSIAAIGSLIGFMMIFIPAVAINYFYSDAIYRDSEAFLNMILGYSFVFTPPGTIIGGVIGAWLGLKLSARKPGQYPFKDKNGQLIIIDAGKDLRRAILALICGLIGGFLALVLAGLVGANLLNAILSLIGLDDVAYALMLVLAPIATGAGALGGIVVVLFKLPPAPELSSA